jgi:aromatic-L-amino-acid decarboxylase
LEPGADEMRTMAGAAVDLLVRFVEGRGAAAASDLDGALELARGIQRDEMPAATGASFGDVLRVVDEATAKAIDTAGPGYFGFIPGGGLFAAALADLLACGTNRFVNLVAPAPACVAIEAMVTRWLCDLFAFPSESQGVLTSGGSMANLSAIVTARTAMLPADFLAGTIYVSAHTHHSVAKSARFAGFPAERVRIVPTNGELRIDVDALEAMVVADRAAGLTPFCIVANAGTTNTGTLDPLAALADLAARERLWLHVDAAYGGFFQLTARGRARLAGIERADSITLDPHKGMFLPYGTGCLLVRDAAALRAAHQDSASYLQDLVVDDLELPDLAQYSPELSRDFRGLRVWLPLRLHGVDAFRDALDEKLDLAEYVYKELVDDPALDVPWSPDLSIVAFRRRDADDEANRRLLKTINASRRIFLSSTSVDGRFTLRVCVLCHRTHRDRVEEAVGIIRDAARAAA